MVRSIARDAVIRKTLRDVNIITGNYEAAYAIGLLLHRLQAEMPDGIQRIEELKELLFEKLDNHEASDEREKILIDMLREYKPSDVWDEDVEALFVWGFQDDNPW